MAESPVLVYEVVDAICTTDYLLGIKNGLAYWLETPSATQLDLNNVAQMDVKDYLRRLIHDWISRKGAVTIGDLVKILEKQDCGQAAGKLRALGVDSPIISVREISESPRDETADDIFNFGVKRPTPNFIGRESELNILSQFLSSKTEQVLVISAFGGQGKSELCRKCIQTLQKSNPQIIISWFLGESLQTLTDGIASLSFNCFGDRKPMNEAVPALRRKFRERIDEAGWLIVVDNVDQPYSELKDIVKQFKECGGHVIITTRKGDVFAGEAIQLKLKALNDKESFEFVRDALHTNPSNEESINKLCHELENQVLALKQSVAFIKMRQSTSIKGSDYKISNYVDELRKYQSSVLDHGLDLDGYEKTIQRNIQMTVEAIKNNHGSIWELARKQMQVLSLIQPDSVSVNFVMSLMESEDKNLLKFMEALELLKSYCLIGADKGTLSIHRLVQKILKETVRAVTVGESVLSNVQRRIAKLTREEMDQAVSIWMTLSSDHELIKKFASFPYKLCDEMADLRHVNPSNDFSKQAYDILVPILGEDNVETMKLKWWYGNSQCFLRKYNDALNIHNQVLEQANRHLTVVGIRFVLQVKRSRAKCLTGLRKFNDALAIFQGTVKTLEDTFGRKDLDTLRTKRSMAICLSKSGKLGKAVTLLKNILVAMKDVLGLNHREVLDIRYAIARCLSLQNKWEQAIPEFQEVIKLQTLHLGPAHPSSLRTRHHMGVCLKKQNKYKEAVCIYEDVLKLQEEHLGPSHYEALITRHTMACCYYDQKKWKEAKLEFEEVVKLRKVCLGEEHEHTLNSMNMLANCLWELGDKDEAIRMKDCVLQTREKVLGPAHPQTRLVRNFLSRNQHRNLLPNSYSQAIQQDRNYNDLNDLWLYT